MKHILDKLELHLRTDRLILEPIVEAHALEMAALLADPDLHTFVPTDPPSLEKQTRVFKIFWNFSWKTRPLNA